MNRPLRVAPSILSADFARLGEQVREAQAAGADLVHIDVMDGRFVPNITLGPLVVRAIRSYTTLPFDVHLMIVEPERHLEAFARAGANHITVHYEAVTHLNRTLSMIRELGCKAGVALNPHTPALLLSDVIGLIDQVIVMTVNPGFGGQAFLRETLPKIAQVRAMLGERPVDIVVDGGINAETASEVVAAGANVLVVGSAIFSERHSVQQGVEALRAALGNQKPG